MTARLRDLGAALDAASFESAFERFRRIADHERRVSDAGIVDLLGA